MRYRRDRIGLLAWTLASASLALLAPVPAAETAGSPSARKLEKLLTRQLRKQDLTLTELSGCKEKKRRDIVACSWHAIGQLAGGIAYDCDERARFLVERRRWKGVKCKNPMVSLMPEPGPHPSFGYNEELLHSEPTQFKLAGSGANVFRQSLFWNVVKQEGWAQWDQIRVQLFVRGIRPLWVLYTTPCQGASVNGPCPDSVHLGPEVYDEFAAFAAQAAQRYPESIGFEVWNEPNAANFWGAEPNPQDYSAMVKKVAVAVHAVDPAMPVVTAGLAPIRNSGSGGMSDEQFLREAYASGGPQAADAIGAHPYPLVRYDENYLGSIRAKLFRYLRVMAEFGDASKPVWVTEAGVSNYGDDEGYNLDQQAEALVNMYGLLRRVANVPVVIFHRFVDDPFGGGSPKESGYGVLDRFDNAKPAYCAVATARGEPC
jgi:hypothetical protein